MFWQVLLWPDNVQFQAVIWHRETYVLSRVSFGGKNSLPIADYDIQKIAAFGRETHPLTYDALMLLNY